MMIQASVDGAHKKELGHENHWTVTRVEILAILKMQQIYPYIAKYMLPTPRTESLSGKLSGGWNWSVRNITSPQFVKCL